MKQQTPGLHEAVFLKSDDGPRKQAQRSRVIGEILQRVGRFQEPHHRHSAKLLF